MIDIGIFAQTAAAAPGAGGIPFINILMMVGVFAIFYVILILPESRRRKKLQKEISEMKQGDKVITSGGIYGTVDFIAEKTIYIKSLDSKFEIAKESVSGIIKNK